MKKTKNQPVYVHLDIKKIFLTPPNTRKEKIILVVVMLLVFMLYFGPLTFSTVHPVKAILISCIPTVTTSWAWIVLLRYIGRKKEFCKESEGMCKP